LKIISYRHQGRSGVGVVAGAGGVIALSKAAPALPDDLRKILQIDPALARRIIKLFTFEGDLVLDPFMGSGSTAVAAAQAGRHYAGYDTDPGPPLVAIRYDFQDSLREPWPQPAFPGNRHRNGPNVLFGRG